MQAGRGEAASSGALGYPVAVISPVGEKKNQVPTCLILSGSLALLRVAPCCFSPLHAEPPFTALQATDSPGGSPSSGGDGASLT